MAEKTNNYELAYHVTAEVDETQAGQIRERVEQLITAAGGIITFSKQPEKTRLSYEIGHQRMSYFGYAQFTLPGPETLAHLDEQMRLDKQIIRHLIVKMEPPSARAKAPRTGIKSERPLRREEAPTTEEGRKEMDKKLEEVISGL